MGLFRRIGEALPAELTSKKAEVPYQESSLIDYFRQQPILSFSRADFEPERLKVTIGALSFEYREFLARLPKDLRANLPSNFGRLGHDRFAKVGDKIHQLFDHYLSQNKIDDMNATVSQVVQARYQTFQAAFDMIQAATQNRA